MTPSPTAHNGDGVANEQDEIDYWDDDYFERTNHLGMYEETPGSEGFDLFADGDDF